MKKGLREITSVRFNKVPIEKDILATVYVVGELFYRVGMKAPLRVLSIDYVNKTKKDRLIITFEGGTYHEIGIQPDTEIFWKDIEETKEKDNAKG